MRAVLLALILVGLVVPVRADEIPRIDVDGSCRLAVQSLGPHERRSPEEQYQECFDGAQGNEDRLRLTWGWLNDSEQASCRLRENFPRIQHHTTYRGLANCAEAMLAQREVEKREAAERVARDAIPKREFR